ncbi:hypothetical protein [Edaphocola flava]|uniref:hypothetical protein n=1 Tax=Edaphocola flava TaxID=2499629 RepID=UPI00100BDAE6|nr:hypothetical protein [Edaphocola flava]
MRIIFTILFCVGFIGNSACSQQHIDFNVRFSELYATYDFMTKISDNYPDNELKTIFEQSAYNTASNREGLRRFEQLPIDYAYAFPQFPKPMKTGLMSRDLLERNLVLSDSLPAFLNRSIGILPANDLMIFAQLLQQFIPVYRSLILLPYKDRFALQQQSLQAYADKGILSDFLTLGLAFYNTKWDPAVPFEICVQPALEADNLGARAFLNIAVCEPPVGLKDHKSFFSVAMHEIYHIIYDNQSLDVKQNIKGWFAATNSPNRQYALLLLNEVLATALGNAYVMDSLNGTIKEDDWYANKYITAMAKEIYPVVKTYIRDKQPIDEAFVRKYVAIYDRQFPNWTKELDHLMTYRYVIADDLQDLNYINKTYRYYSYKRSGVPFSIAEADRIRQEPVTKVFIISRNHKEILAALRQQYSVLQKHAFNYKKEFIHVSILEDQTRLMIINRYASSTATLMNNWFPGKVIP